VGWKNRLSYRNGKIKPFGHVIIVVKKFGVRKEQRQSNGRGKKETDRGSKRDEEDYGPAFL
jgi:hypothetical protein